MADKHIVVAAHGYCFDGLVSAAMFTFLRNRLDNKAIRFSYKSCGYGPNMQVVPERWLKGDENAIVDFRYTASTKLTWYFDHHPTAFANDVQQREATGRKRVHFDASYGSCTKLIRDVGTSVYGVDFSRFEELVAWADRIDSASFETAAEAVDRSSPIMQLAAVVEQHGNGDLYQHLAPRLVAESVDSLAESSYVQSRWKVLGEAQRKTQARIESRLERRGDVAFVDLHDAPLAGSGKFVAYAVAPECRYAVSLIRMKKHLKVSIGYNPWSPKERTHDVAAICRRHGGGGHAVVGAFSVPLDKLDDARRITQEVVDELNR
ncbi:MAG: hypothetical protein RIF41_33540 [Polyangiaceae bacterium]